MLRRGGFPQPSSVVEVVAMTCPPLLARLLIRSGVARLVPSLQRRLEGGADYLRFYSDRLLTSPLRQLERIAAAMESDNADVIDLSCGSPRFDLLSSASTKLPPDRRGWPSIPGLPELRGAVAAKLLTENRLAFSPAEEILITAGALGAVQTILDAFVNRGDRVVLPDPISPLYPLLVRTRGARVSWIGTRTDEGRLRLRFDHLARHLRGARLLVLNSPANPTGGILHPEDLEQITWWADRHDALVLSDEVFDRYHHESEPTSIATFSRARARTLTVGSVSKSHALASARTGWIAAHRHLLRPCIATAALRAPFVPTLSQVVALTALRTAPESFAPVLAQFDSRRRYAFERLRAMGLSPVWPHGAFFLWLPVPTGWRTGELFAETLLTTRRVRVLPGDLFGPSGKAYVRLSYAADEGRLEEGLNRMADLIKGPRPKVGLFRRAA
jgi:aspartate/methionine/tyrosine aminotransferase